MSKKRLIAPSYLTARQKKKWREVIQKLKQVGTFNAADLDIVDLYAVAWVRYETLLKQMQKEDEVLISPKTGSLYQHPKVGLIHATHTQIVKLAETLGLSPEGRRKLKPDQPADDDDDFAEFIAD